MPVVFTAANPFEAHLCKQFLDTHGIEAVVDGEILWMSRGEFPLSEATNPRVNVSEENESRALELIQQFQDEHRERELETAWTCENCAELNPSGFEVCWNCETPAGSAADETLM